MFINDVNSFNVAYFTWQCWIVTQRWTWCR